MNDPFTIRTYCCLLAILPCITTVIINMAENVRAGEDLRVVCSLLLEGRGYVWEKKVTL